MEHVSAGAQIKVVACVGNHVLVCAISPDRRAVIFIKRGEESNINIIGIGIKLEDETAAANSNARMMASEEEWDAGRCIGIFGTYKGPVSLFIRMSEYPTKHLTFEV